MQDTELLQYVHETAEMGIQGLKSLEGRVRDQGLRQALAQQTEEYRDISAAAGALLRSYGAEPKNPSLMARLSSEIMSAVKTLAAPSASNIAEMVIQGNTMGIIKGTRHLNDYAGNDRQTRQLAEKLLRTEEANVAQMKQYL